eukprot:11795427-Alexandrium_andersonii.AAC.1
MEFWAHWPRHLADVQSGQTLVVQAHARQEAFELEGLGRGEEVVRAVDQLVSIIEGLDDFVHVLVHGRRVGGDSTTLEFAGIGREAPSVRCLDDGTMQVRKPRGLQ